MPLLALAHFTTSIVLSNMTQLCQLADLAVHDARTSKAILQQFGVIALIWFAGSSM